MPTTSRRRRAIASARCRGRFRRQWTVVGKRPVDLDRPAARKPGGCGCSGSARHSPMSTSSATGCGCSCRQRRRGCSGDRHGRTSERIASSRRRAGGEATGSRPSDRSSPMCTDHLCIRRSRTRTGAITGRAISPQVNDTLGPALQDDDAGSIPDTGSTRHQLDNNGMPRGYGHRLVARRQIRDLCGLVRRRGVDRRGRSTPRRRARRCGRARSDRSSARRTWIRSIVPRSSNQPVGIVGDEPERGDLDAPGAGVGAARLGDRRRPRRVLPRSALADTGRGTAAGLLPSPAGSAPRRC